MESFNVTWAQFTELRNEYHVIENRTIEIAKSLADSYLKEGKRVKIVKIAGIPTYYVLWKYD